MKDFRSLIVWEKAHRLTLTIYKIIDNFSGKQSQYLADQLREVSTFIPARIAEAYGQQIDDEALRSMLQVIGAVSKLEYLLMLACDLGYISSEMYETIGSEIADVRKHVVKDIQYLTCRLDY